MKRLVLLQVLFADPDTTKRVGMLIPTVILPSLCSVKLVGMALVSRLTSSFNNSIGNTCPKRMEYGQFG